MHTTELNYALAQLMNNSRVYSTKFFSTQYNQELAGIYTRFLRLCHILRGIFPSILQQRRKWWAITGDTFGDRRWRNRGDHRSGRGRGFHFGAKS